MYNIFIFPCISLFYIVLLIIIYFSKERITRKENKVYNILIMVALIELVLEILLDFVGPIYSSLSFMSYFIAKFYSVFIAIWITFLSLYIGIISLKMKKKEQYIKKLEFLFGVVLSIAILLIFILPINFFHEGNIAYTYGSSINVVYGVSFIFISICMGLLVWNSKNCKDKRFLPILVFIVVGGICSYIQMKNPELLLATTVHAFITFIMYFTIENPDMQMVDELLKNRELVEKSVNDKSNFLFKVSGEMKKPIKSIIKSVKDYKDASSSEEKDDIVNDILSDANIAHFIINDITNISSMDVKKIKVQGNKYSSKKLFADIGINIKNQLSLNKKNDLDFKFNINNDIPEYLVGDYIKLKQVILSIVANSIKYTKNGFIDIDLDAITRYDMCRLIFTIKDSGCGISLSKMNEILSCNDEVDVIEYQKIDSLDMQLPIIIKILKLLGGSINIKSEENKGTTVVIVIDQQIDLNSNEIKISDVKKYNTSIKKKKRVLIADDSENLEKIERITSKLDVEVVTTLIGKDVVDKINSGNLFDLIILKDEMKPDSAYSILKELKKNNKFKTPVVIMINKDKEFIKDHFISDGFSDYVILDYINQDLKKVLEKYI